MNEKRTIVLAPFIHERVGFAVVSGDKGIELA